MKKVAIFEYKFHDEVILPQIYFLLNQSIEVHLITTEEIIQNGLFDSILDKIHTLILPKETISVRKLRILTIIPHYLRKNEINYFVNNTLDSNIAFWMSKRLKFLTQIGILHNGRFFKRKGKHRRNLKYIKQIFSLPCI